MSNDALDYLSRGRKPMPVPERLMGKFTVGDGCWEWLPSVDSNGYGQFSLGSIRDGSFRHITAHRAVYQWLVGPIPEGLQLDHLCCNRICVRPDHLEPVTQAENTRRVGERSLTCHKGHPWTDGHAFFAADGRRRCRTCRNTYKRAWRQKRAAA